MVYETYGYLQVFCAEIVPRGPLGCNLRRTELGHPHFHWHYILRSSMADFGRRKLHLELPVMELQQNMSFGLNFQGTCEWPKSFTHLFLNPFSVHRQECYYYIEGAESQAHFHNYRVDCIITDMQPHVNASFFSRMVGGVAWCHGGTPIRSAHSIMPPSLLDRAKIHPAQWPFP